MIKFSSLFYAFREEYISPLTENFPCARTLNLSCLVGDDVFRRGFESSYDSFFVKGCHIPRIPRAAGITAFPETEHRIMYRNLIKDLWEILGPLFLMHTCFVYNFLIIRFRRRWFWSFYSVIEVLFSGTGQFCFAYYRIHLLQLSYNFVHLKLNF